MTDPDKFIMVFIKELHRQGFIDSIPMDDLRALISTDDKTLTEDQRALDDAIIATLRRLQLC